MKFINVKSAKTTTSNDNVDKVIAALNKAVKEGDTNLAGDYAVNTILDSVPQLSNEEFKIACAKAKEEGWFLYNTDDNYNSVTYILKHA